MNVQFNEHISDSDNTHSEPILSSAVINSNNIQQETPNVADHSEYTNKSRQYKILKSFFLFNAWICMGLWASLPSPCIDALRAIVGCNYEQISRPLAVKMAGIMAGSLFFGLLTDKFKKRTDLILCIELLLAGLSITAIPWIPNLIAMSCSFFVNGIAHGGLSSVGNIHAINMWGKDAASPLLFIHMGYSLGTILGPVLVSPYLVESQDHANDKRNITTVFKSASIDGQTLPFNVHLKSVYMSLFYDNNVWSEKWESNTLDGNGTSNSTVSDIKVPFGAAGGFTVVISAVFLIYAVIPRYEYRNTPITRPLQRKLSMAEIVSPASCTGGNTVYGIQMFLLLFLLYVMFLGKDTCVTSFLQPLAVHTKTLDFTIKQADFLITIHYSCYTLGRIIMAIAAKWISIKILLCLELVSVIGAQISLIIFGLDSKLNFWLTTSSYALVSGPILPTGFSWMDRYVKMTAFGYAIMNVGIGVGGFLFQWICGYIYNYKSHVYLLYLSLICGVIELILYIITQSIGARHGDRYLKVTDVMVTEESIQQNGHTQVQDIYDQHNGDIYPHTQPHTHEEYNGDLDPLLKPNK